MIAMIRLAQHVAEARCDRQAAEQVEQVERRGKMTVVKSERSDAA